MRKFDNWKRQLGLMVLALLVGVASPGTSLLASAGAATEAYQKEKSEKTEKKDKKAKKHGQEEAAETASADDQESSSKKKKKKGGSGVPSNAPVERGTPILWKGHPDIKALNLFWGPGGEEGVPKPPFTFIKEDITGTNPKVKITDANGVKWNVKFDEEVHAEVAASRIAWACGYGVEESYYIPSGKIDGVTGLGRAKPFVRPDGSFSSAMFENRPDDVARRNIRWSWESNPFVGTKELSGLAILNALLNNWDAKVDNNNVLGMVGDDNKVYDWYIQSDWGGTFGKTGSFSKSKWDLNDYSRQAFLDGASGGKLQLHYSGKMGGGLKSVPLDHAHWFASIVWQLTDDQIRDAFRAAGATEQEIAGFTARIRQKINELYSITNR